MNNMYKYALRSLMFVPAHNDRLLKSASKTNADVLLLDVEDSVQLKAHKQVARDNIVKYVQNGIFQNHLVFPRINDRESGQLLKDLTQLTLPGIDGFVYPKSYTGQDVFFIDKLLETIEYEKGYAIGTFKLILLIETSASVLNAQEICRASSRVIAIAFGCEDFITDLGGIHDKEGKSIFTPRAIIAMAARANNVIPIDGVHINVHDLDDLEKNLILAKKLGFEGMLVLNPKELPMVHQYFSPSLEEIKDAHEIVRLYEEMQKDGMGVAIIDNKFIGPPMFKAAKMIIQKYKMLSEVIKEMAE